MIEFKDLPDSSTPINADNLNNNFNAVFYKETKSFDTYSNLNTLVQDIYSNKDKECIGAIGTLYDTNLKTLLGDPQIGNYTTCVFEHITGDATEGCIRVTAQAPYTSNFRIAYFIYDSQGIQYTGWIGTNNFVQYIIAPAETFDDFKSWLINSAPTGVFTCWLNISGAVSTAIVMKANNNYLSFIHFSYAITAKQYKYANGIWVEEQL